MPPAVRPERFEARAARRDPPGGRRARGRDAASASRPRDRSTTRTASAWFTASASSKALFGVDLRAELARVLQLDRAADSLPQRCGGVPARRIGRRRRAGPRPRDRASRSAPDSGRRSSPAGEIVRSGEGVPPNGELHVVPFRGAPVEDAISGRAISARFDGRTDAAEIAARADAGDARRRRRVRVVRCRPRGVPRAVGARRSGRRASSSADRSRAPGATSAKSCRRSRPPATRLDDAALLGAAAYAVR